MTDLTLEGFLSGVDSKAITILTDELADTKKKVQRFRTESEMRFSVLNDSRFGTYAAKYWQSVREQAVHYEALEMLSFEYRRNESGIIMTQESLASENLSDRQRRDAAIDLDEALWKRERQQLDAADRVREITLWSKIKQECIDNPDRVEFDTENVNTHQLESYLRQYQNRAKALTPGTSQGEIFNILGQLNTIRRLLGTERQEFSIDAPWLKGQKVIGEVIARSEQIAGR